jgi:hypothetical protein
MTKLNGLPNFCFILAACAAQALRFSGLKAHLLRVTGKDGKKPKKDHAVVVFQWEDRLRVYDQNGTTTLVRRHTMHSSPTAIAKAWQQKHHVHFPFEKITGEWIDKPFPHRPNS